MRFRPCIDLHAGVVKQIVGSTLKDAAPGEEERPETNFVATKPSEEFARCALHECSCGGTLTSQCARKPPLAGRSTRRLTCGDARVQDVP